jgi:hypothetical protein
VRGFAFVERIPRAAVPALEAAERTGGVSAFTVRSDGSAPELYVDLRVKHAADLDFLGPEKIMEYVIFMH